MSQERDTRSSFAGQHRTLNAEDELVLTSVGIDVGSATTNLAFSRLVMTRLGTRYVVTQRELLFESAMRLTPYAEDTEIDAQTLGAFVEAQYASAGLSIEQIDTGALILTGVAAERDNARAIGAALAESAGKLVAVSAGDALEAALVAYGGGAMALSRDENLRVMAVDIGGGTCKIAICEAGRIVDRTVVDVGARVLRFDDASIIAGIEQAGHRVARDAGIEIVIGERLTDTAARRAATHIADVLFEAIGAQPASRELAEYLRLPPLSASRKPDIVVFSGGVAEYLHGREQRTFGDLGPLLAEAVRERAQAWQVLERRPSDGIRATVIGASQYVAQLSGNTIFVSPEDILPLRNVVTVRPPFDLEVETIDRSHIAREIRQSLVTLGIDDAATPVALCFGWHGSASFERLDALCHGIIEAFDRKLAAGLPLILVTDADVGGLIGMHSREECLLDNPIVSIDGIELGALDFIDIGTLIESSGAVPVVVKSLQFGVPPRRAA